MKNKSVLVTGASGFIGSHLVQRLVREGARVRAMLHYRGDPGLHNLEFLCPDELSSIEIIRGDVRDPFFVRRSAAECDVVFHLAALIGIPFSYLAPSSYVSTNVQGTVNVLEACRGERVSRVIHTSTSECYGTAEYTPIDEKHPLQGQSPYSASKIGADKIAESYYRSFHLPVVTLRPFNTFGPRQSARAVIPSIIGQVVSAQESLKLGSLSPVRDLTYVTDTVDAFVRAATVENIEGELINLGTGMGISVGDLASRIMRLADRELCIEQDSQRVRPPKSEVEKLISDNSKAVNMLGWMPRISLDQGLCESIEFARRYPNSFRTRDYAL